ncbi:MAG: hypothetical protein M3O34_18825 [Chloroflexota bacterium]|nr:hypothetical protein [Chloroflexota bacterium]
MAHPIEAAGLSVAREDAADHPGLERLDLAPAEPLDWRVAANAAGGPMRYLSFVYRADDPEGERRAWATIGVATR